MVDKVWNDWQRAHANNFWAFEGGTVRDLDTWPQYTNGAPPAMTVGLHSSSLLYIVILYQRTPSAWLHTSDGWHLSRQLHPKKHLQYHFQWSSLLHLRIIISRWKPRGLSADHDTIPDMELMIESSHLFLSYSYDHFLFVMYNLVANFYQL